MATETAVDVVMPQMGVSVSEGTITKWLKQEGEQIEADEPLLEISTDKVDTEVPSPASGTLTQILVQEGETVDVGTKLGQIGGSAAAGAPPQESAPGPRAARGPAPPGPPRQGGRPGARGGAGAGHGRGGRRGGCRVSCRESRADGARAVRGSTRGSRAHGQRQGVRLAGGRADRVGARTRSIAGPGHRIGRTGDEEGHPRLRRIRRGATAATAGAGAAAGRSARAGAGRSSGRGGTAAGSRRAREGAGSPAAAPPPGRR